MYTPWKAATKQSTPMPLSAMRLAVFRQPGASVWNSLRSVSRPCSLPSSRMNSRPGPQVGRAESEHRILPPVGASASPAAFSADSSAGSGFLTSAKSRGSCVSRASMAARDA